MLALGQPIMIGWLTAAHEPLSEPAHARAPPEQKESGAEFFSPWVRAVRGRPGVGPPKVIDLGKDS